MARTALTPQTLINSYPSIPLTADSADYTYTAGDAVNGNSFPHTGKEIILARNVGASPATITIDSVDDPYNRQGDISAYSIGASEFAAFPPFPVQGWRQSDGKMYIDVSSTDIELAILRLPS